MSISVDRVCRKCGKDVILIVDEQIEEGSYTWVCPNCGRSNQELIARLGLKGSNCRANRGAFSGGLA